MSLWPVLGVAGSIVRVTGKVVDKVGLSLQGGLGRYEKAIMHKRALPFKDFQPALAGSAVIASDAQLVGDVVVGERSSVWNGSVVRGDRHQVNIGALTKIGEGSVVLGTSKPVTVGNKVTVGEGSVLNGCSIKDEAFIGPKSVISGTVSSRAAVAAGTTVTGDQSIPSGELWAGNPAQFVRKLDASEISRFGPLAEGYSILSEAYGEEQDKDLATIEEEKDIRKTAEEIDPDYTATIDDYVPPDELLKLEEKMVEVTAAMMGSDAPEVEQLEA